MSEPNQYERQMLDLINGERAAAGLNPLRFNSDLNDSSEDHSAWMLENNAFSHTGISGSSATDRIRDARYPLEGSWALRAAKKRGKRLGRPPALTDAQIAHAKTAIEAKRETVSAMAEILGLNRSTLQRAIARDSR